ncbi:MAG: hypothetical protein NVS9B4_28470 [Candidatus Acidiferrum sp.]
MKDRDRPGENVVLLVLAGAFRVEEGGVLVPPGLVDEARAARAWEWRGMDFVGCLASRWGESYLLSGSGLIEQFGACVRKGNRV